jgi:hypothetical protein
MKRVTILLVLFAGMFAMAETGHAQFVNWTGGTGNYSTGASWFNESLAQSGFLPSVDFNETGRIDNGGVVSVTTQLANSTDQGASTNPGALLLGTVAGSGELNVASGGSLRVQQGTTTNGGMQVGGAGTGTIRVLPGGSLTVDGPLNVAASVANMAQFGASAGAGTATVSVGSASFGGSTAVYRNAAFNSAGSIGFQSTSVYQPIFSGGLTSTLQAAGAVQLGGKLQPNFGGVTPAVGSTWSLAEGSSVSGAFSSIDTSLAGAPGLGQKFVVTTADVAGNRKSVQLSFRQSAVLNVNRDTGVASLTNPGTTPISLDGYTITSSLGVLGTASWNSLHDQNALGGTWRESPASATRLSELKQSGVASLGAGQSVSLGAIFAPNPTAIGQPTEDLALQYAAPDGVFDGVVNYTGTKVNNILLQIDPTTGQARLRNTSNFTVQMDGYTIASSGGSLSAAGWNSLDDQNAAGGDWRESPGSPTRLSELKRASFTTLAPGASFSLGSLFSPSQAKDLTFQYLAFGQSAPANGQVLYAAITANLPGDFNHDNVVSSADLTVWRSSVGSGAGADADGDGDSDGNDFLIWQRNLGMTAAAAGAAAAVPEPSALHLLMMLAIALLGANATQLWPRAAVCKAPC